MSETEIMEAPIAADANQSIKKSGNKKSAAMGAGRSVLQEREHIELASAMIDMGARLQVLQSETSLSYERLSRLYREIKGKSAPRGMLPFSADWFMNWRANIHASVFYSIYTFLTQNTPVDEGVSALVKAYGLYLGHEEIHEDEEPILSFTRAWMLLRFMRSNMLQMTPCSSCNMSFVTHAHQPENEFVCPICRPPARVVGMITQPSR